MTDTNPNARLETFCDGVFAIALTLLIIDIKVPATADVHDTTSLWLALRHLAPAVSAFLLSFTVILITWVNHHAAMTLVNKSSPLFIYANGFLLLTVVLVPFPAALAGDYLTTDHAAPAVVLYDAVLALQSVGWILLGGAALTGQLMKNHKSALAMRYRLRFGYYALLLYSLCAVVAVWYPLAMAGVTSVTWFFWLIFGLSAKHE